MLIRCVAAAGVLVLGLALAACSAAPLTAAPQTGGTGSGGDPSQAVLLAYDGRSHAELDVTSGASRITIGTGQPGGPLVRAATPAGSGVRPVLLPGRIVRVGLDQTGLRGPARLRIWLSPSVRWRLVIGGGASTLVLNLAAARLSGLDITAGFSVITVRLPDPAGPVKVVLGGGASRVQISLPPGVPASLRLGGGAGSATIGGRSRTGIAAGTLLRTKYRAKGNNNYEIVATAGIASIRVT